MELGGVRRGVQRLVTGCVVGAVSMVVIAPPAGAQESYDSLEGCVQARPMDVDIMSWGCMERDGVFTPMVSSFGGGGFGEVPGFGLFVVFAVVWILVPLGIAAMLAIDRDESVGVAVGLTLVLGWIGLAIVYFGQTNTRDAVNGLAARAAPSSTASWPGPAAPASTPIAPPSTTVEDRLARLDTLHSDGLVSESEYQDQRRRILDSI